MPCPPSASPPSPPRRERRWLALALLGLLLGAGGLIATVRQTAPALGATGALATGTDADAPPRDAPSQASTPRLQAGGGAAMRRAGGSGGAGAAAATSPATPLFPSGLARAYAALGELRDGRRQALPALDEDARGYLEQARELVDQDQPLLHIAIPRPPGTAPAQARQPIHGDLDKVLTEPDAWVAIPYDPGRTASQPLTITNRSSGEYGYSLHGADFGSVRVDGGLVVPGRFYRLQGMITIQSEVSVGVHLRPLATLGSYGDAPRLPPGGKG